MQKLFSLLSVLTVLVSYSQPNTDVFLFDLKTTNNVIKLSNNRNISANDGYDNQPSFLDSNTVVFAGTRNGQTDIVKYIINYDSKIFINHTEGGEYSPLKIPNRNEVSAVRLDPDGLQRLYTYDLRNGESTELVKDLVVAYYTWFDDNTIVCAVIEDNGLNLFVVNVKDGTNKKIQDNVGRSFHKIPNSNLVSFVSKENNVWQIKSLNPKTGAIKVIANTMDGVEDICWLNGKTILSGKESILYKLTLQKDNNWKYIADLNSKGISKITRLATNQESSMLLIAGDINNAIENKETTDPKEDNSNTNKKNPSISEKQASEIVQKHIEPFNNRQLIEFSNAFDENVTVYRFPNSEMYSGRNTLKENYKQFFNKTEKSNVKVLNRMTFKNIVVDEELGTSNNKTNRHVTIYETDAENINSMTFLNNSKTTSNPEVIVDKQLEAYNKRDIDAFVNTYSVDIKLYTFRNEATTLGQAALRRQYASFFERAPDLNAEIVNRIVLGNKVIDKEKIIVNGRIFYAVAIYEIEDGLISKVTFIQ